MFSEDCLNVEARSFFAKERVRIPVRNILSKYSLLSAELLLRHRASQSSVRPVFDRNPTNLSPETLERRRREVSWFRGKSFRIRKNIGDGFSVEHHDHRWRSNLFLQVNINLGQLFCCLNCWVEKGNLPSDDRTRLFNRVCIAHSFYWLKGRWNQLLDALLSS